MVSTIVDEPKPEISTGSLGVGDIYYILFRQKWKILFLTFLGFLAAFETYRLWPKTVYRSDAKLFIRYIQESGAPITANDETQIKSTDQRGETIINSELEILTSMDLAREVARELGPERILDVYGGGDDLDAAAGVIRGGLAAVAPRGSRVIELVFEHPDPEVVQPVLSTLIAEYLKKHVEVHMTTGIFDDLLSKETLALRDQLAKTEDELRQVQNRAGVVSLEETKRANAEQMSKLQQQIWETSLELAQGRALMEDYQRTKKADEAVPAITAQEYRGLIGALDTQTRKYQELLATFSPSGSLVSNLRQRIAENTAAKEKLEAEYPALTTLVIPVGAPSAKADAAVYDEATEQARLRQLSTRLKVLQDDLERMRKESTELSALDLTITDLQRRKDLQESRYKYFSSSLEKSRINEALGSDRVSNITTIESPTPPIRDVGKLYKVVTGLALGGLGVGLALAFCLELFLDQTVRRPSEIETLFGLPLFFSIPNVRPRFLPFSRRAELLPASSAGGANPHPPPHRPPHKLAPYFDALRDHLLFYFEIRNLTKKPKLVAVTSCGEKSGTSTVAAGLAAALSKIGEGNVLLVDMTMGNHSPAHFRNGEVTVGLDQLLDGQNRDDARVQQNLYVVPHATGEERIARILPKRFTDLIPRLRSSDYDYIIFDMPPVNQVSVTPQLARYMDMVFLLVESEKTNRGALKRAANLLASASCTLGVVVNRTRNYLPRALLQEV